MQRTDLGMNIFFGLLLIALVAVYFVIQSPAPAIGGYQ
jgi:hypothetical protein